MTPCGIRARSALVTRLGPREAITVGVFSGSLTYKVFFAHEDPPDDWENFYVERVNLHAFEELQPDDEEDESIGWVQIERPLETSFELPDLRYDHFINLGLRRDRYAIPKARRDAHIAEAEREYRVKNDKEDLNKYEREDIEHMVTRELREETLPKMRVIDVSWDLRTGRVRFWSHANKLGELFQELFQETFEMDLVPASPYVNAIELGLPSHRIEALQTAEATNFIDDGSTTVEE